MTDAQIAALDETSRNTILQIVRRAFSPLPFARLRDTVLDSLSFD